MFENKNSEQELFQSMGEFLAESLNKEAHQIEKLVKAAEELSIAAELFDEVGLTSVSDKILDVLVDIK